jgi:hypothetical protein
MNLKQDLYGGIERNRYFISVANKEDRFMNITFIMAGVQRPGT